MAISVKIIKNTLENVRGEGLERVVAVAIVDSTETIMSYNGLEATLYMILPAECNPPDLNNISELLRLALEWADGPNNNTKRCMAFVELYHKYESDIIMSKKDKIQAQINDLVKQLENNVVEDLRGEAVGYMDKYINQKEDKKSECVNPRSSVYKKYGKNGRLDLVVAHLDRDISGMKAIMAGMKQNLLG